MAKAPSPLVGYNNNVRHKGRVFHIQTEDSGLSKPHIITHLFMDGGRILKSTKRSYAEHVEADDVADIVRKLMKEQHKAMFIALRDGTFDDVIEGKPGAVARPSGEVAAAGPKKIPTPPPSSRDSATIIGVAPEATGGRPLAQESTARGVAKIPTPPPSSRGGATIIGVAPEAAGRLVIPAITLDDAPPLSGIPVSDAVPTQAAPRLEPIAPPAPSPADEPSAPALSPLVASAAAAENAPSTRRSSSPAMAPADLPLGDLPPPPRAQGARESVPSARYRSLVPPSEPPREARRPSNRPPSAPPRGRVGVSRPAEIFRAPRRAMSPAADAILRDKSLDEIILGYLAEELDG